MILIDDVKRSLSTVFININAYEYKYFPHQISHFISLHTTVREVREALFNCHGNNL